MYRLVCLIALASAVAANDVKHGHEHGKKIFESNQTASPAIWRRDDKFTINATNDEVISGVIITDLREKKDGEAQIVEGGQGHKNVTFELKSPAVFRGYEFHVEVYSVPDNGAVQTVNNDMQGNVPAFVGGIDEKDVQQVQTNDMQGTQSSKPAFVGGINEKDGQQVQTNEMQGTQSTKPAFVGGINEKDIQQVQNNDMQGTKTDTPLFVGGNEANILNENKTENAPTSEMPEAKTSVNAVTRATEQTTSVKPEVNIEMGHDTQINDVQTAQHSTIEAQSTTVDRTTETVQESSTGVDVSQYAQLKNMPSPQIHYGYQNKHIRKEVF